jgi:hypothetical protein
MQLITSETLHKLGIHKSEAEEKALIAHFEETLNERVGQTIFSVLSDEQVDELNKLSDKGDEEALDNWLSRVVPKYEELVKAEYDILMGELAGNADNL